MSAILKEKIENTHRKKARISFDEAQGKTIELKTVNGRDSIHADLLNISAGGFAVRMSDEDYNKIGPIGVDELLSAELKSIGITDLMPMVKVVRLQTVEGGYLFGLAFHCLTKDSEESLDRYVGRHKLKSVLISEQYMTTTDPMSFSEELNFSEKVVMAAQYFYFKTKEALNIVDPTENNTPGQIVPLIKSSIDSDQLWINSPFWFDKSA